MHYPTISARVTAFKGHLGHCRLYRRCELWQKLCDWTPQSITRAIELCYIFLWYSIIMLHWSRLISLSRLSLIGLLRSYFECIACTKYNDRMRMVNGIGKKCPRFQCVPIHWIIFWEQDPRIYLLIRSGWDDSKIESCFQVK